MGTSKTALFIAVLSMIGHIAQYLRVRAMTRALTALRKAYMNHITNEGTHLDTHPQDTIDDEMAGEL